MSLQGEGNFKIQTPNFREYSMIKPQKPGAQAAGIARSGASELSQMNAATAGFFRFLTYDSLSFFYWR
jgi:hypothetical protein